MGALRVQLLVIDGQKDFMDDPDSALPVPGANADMDRTAALVDRIGHRLDDIAATLDTQYVMDYRHPGAWRNAAGEHPLPITQGGALITADDIRNGIWIPLGANTRPPVLGGITVKEFMIICAETRASEGVPGLEIWPEHCIIGSPGHNLQANLRRSLQAWERNEGACVNYCTKGTNVYTEHYGALMANVPIAADPSTQLNTDFLESLMEADVLGVAMEALSHCGMTTVDQIVANFGKAPLSKIHLLTDCTSPIPKVGNGPDFPAMSAAWLRKMEAMGLVLTTSTEFMA